MARQAARHSKPPVAARLREAMALTGVTNDELAVRLGVGVRLVQKWRAGDVIPSYANLRALERELGKPVAWFWTETEAA